MNGRREEAHDHSIGGEEWDKSPNVLLSINTSAMHLELYESNIEHHHTYIYPTHIHIIYIHNPTRQIIVFIFSRSTS
jgi:hypothetical protein